MYQHSFKLGSNFRGGVTPVVVHGAPFYKAEEFLAATVQHGEIKVYGLCDKTEEGVEHEFLIVGTGAVIPSDYLESLVLVGTVLLSDSKYGYTVYYVKREISEDGFDEDSENTDASATSPVSLDPFQNSLLSLKNETVKAETDMSPVASHSIVAVVDSNDPAWILNLKSVLGKINEVVAVEVSKGKYAIKNCIADYEDLNVLIITCSRDDAIIPSDLITLFGVSSVVTH